MQQKTAPLPKQRCRFWGYGFVLLIHSGEVDALNPCGEVLSRETAADGYSVQAQRNEGATSVGDGAAGIGAFNEAAVVNASRIASEGK